MGLPRGAVELRGSGGHEIRVMVGVPGPGLHLRTGLDKLRERVLADRLQEGIAGGAVRLVDLHQGAVREEGHGVQELQRMRALLPAHRLRRSEGEASPEHRQAVEELPGLGSEKFVAPVDGRPEGPVPGHGPAPPRGQEVEEIREAVADLRWSQVPDPGGGGLDGQGDSVHPAADLGHQDGPGRP